MLFVMLTYLSWSTDSQSTARKTTNPRMQLLNLFFKESSVGDFTVANFGQLRVADPSKTMVNKATWRAMLVYHHCRYKKMFFSDIFIMHDILFVKANH